MSKFLTEDWAQDITNALNSDEAFKNAIGGADLAIQFETEGGPDGDVDYYMRSSGGATNVAIGTLEDADVTVKGSYETLVSISKGELNAQTAFMTGKLKVSGNLAKLMMHQSAIQQYAAVGAKLDVEF